MERHPVICIVAAIFAAAAPVSANDFTEACRAFGTADVIFVGRVKSAPITRRVSGEDAIEKARVVAEAAERELKAFEALNMPPEIGAGRHRELTLQMVRARQAFDTTRAMHPPPFDLSLTPLVVETAFRGVTTPELFMWNKGQPELDPARTYLFYAVRPMDRLAPDVIFADRPKELETADADLRFLGDVVAGDGSAVVYGSLTFEDPDDAMRRTPLAGVPLRVSLNGQRYESTTGADGSFMLTGVPPGLLRIDPVLPEHMILPPQSAGGMVKGGCLKVDMRATFNGRILGRVLLDSGEPFRGSVDLVPLGPRRSLLHTHAMINGHGEYAFTAVPPGRYLLGINASRQPSSGAPFRPTYFPGTTERDMATPVTVGYGSEHGEINWIVSERLREGTVEVTFDTHGQPQKDMGVCVITYDSDDRPSGGVGYDRRTDAPVVVHVVEGIKYRFVAHARTPQGLARSDEFDSIGAAGRQSIRLSVASVKQNPTGSPCTFANPKPFSPSR